MDTYFVDYDLKKKHERDYKELYAALKALKAVRMLESLWALKQNDTNCREIYDGLKPFTHRDDALSVSKVETWVMLNTEATPTDIGPKTTK